MTILIVAVKMDIMKRRFLIPKYSWSVKYVFLNVNNVRTNSNVPSV